MSQLSTEAFSELTLKLVRKSVEAAGICPWDGDTYLRPVVTGVDDDVAFITAGKDFALLRTQHGRVSLFAVRMIKSNSVLANKAGNKTHYYIPSSCDSITAFFFRFCTVGKEQVLDKNVA